MFRSRDSIRPARGLYFFLAILTLAAATGAQAQVQIAQQIAVPAYYWPGDYGPNLPANFLSTDWTALTAEGPAGSSKGVTTIAIANVNNGPDYRAYPDTTNPYSPNWGPVINNAHSAGIKVLGYVDTGYFGTTGHLTRRRASDVESWRSQIEHDIDAWYSFYPGNISGIFLDEGLTRCGPTNSPSDTTWSDLYRNIRDYVKNNHPGAVIAANPGTQPAYCYEEAADILVSYEGDAVCYVRGGPTNTPTNPPSGLPAACSTGLNAQGQATYYFYVSPQNNGWPAYADPNKFWNLLYDVNASSLQTIQNTMNAIKQNNVGYAYMTTYVLPNPYGTIAYDPFWELEQQYAAPLNASSTGPAAVTILGTPVISYTTATIEWSLSSSPNGVVGYDIYQSGVSENGGRMWSVPQPTGQNTAWVDLDGLLQPNTAYTFTVVARDAAGLQSTASNPVTFTTAASTQSPPSAPGNLQATATTYTTTTLSWNPSTGSLTVVAYDIYENGSKILTLTESINNGPATGTTIIGLTPGTAYTFNVVARDWQGNRSTASNVSVTPPTLPGGGAISSPTAAYTSATGLLTYSVNFLVPFSNHRVFIWSGNPNNVNGQNCYWAGFAPTQLCTDYLIQDDGSLWVYTGGSSGQYSWAALTPSVQPTFTDPTNSNAYTWQIPFSSLAGGVVANTKVMFDADGFFAPTYSGIISTTAN